MIHWNFYRIFLKNNFISKCSWRLHCFTKKFQHSNLFSSLTSFYFHRPHKVFTSNVSLVDPNLSLLPVYNWGFLSSDSFLRYPSHSIHMRSSLFLFSFKANDSTQYSLRTAPFLCSRSSSSETSFLPPIFYCVPSFVFIQHSLSLQPWLCKS